MQTCEPLNQHPLMLLAAGPEQPPKPLEPPPLVDRPLGAGVPGGVERVLAHSLFLKQRKDEAYDANVGLQLVDDLDHANLITSIPADQRDAFDKGEETDHYFVIDLDFPAYVVPSSTPGHNHLYIDKRMTADDFFELLEAFVKAGLLEPGYFGASVDRKFTAVRPPWVHKEKG